MNPYKIFELRHMANPLGRGKNVSMLSGIDTIRENMEIDPCEISKLGRVTYPLDRGESVFMISGMD